MESDLPDPLAGPIAGPTPCCDYIHTHTIQDARQSLPFAVYFAVTTNSSTFGSTQLYSAGHTEVCWQSAAPIPFSQETILSLTMFHVSVQNGIAARRDVFITPALCTAVFWFSGGPKSYKCFPCNVMYVFRARCSVIDKTPLTVLVGMLTKLTKP